jgi:hypothetical protein
VKRNRTADWLGGGRFEQKAAKIAKKDLCYLSGLLFKNGSTGQAFLAGGLRDWIWLESTNRLLAWAAVLSVGIRQLPDTHREKRKLNRHIKNPRPRTTWSF